MTKKKTKKRPSKAKAKGLPTKLVLWLCWRALKVAMAVSKQRGVAATKKDKAKKTIPQIQKKINEIRATKLKQKPIKWRKK